MRDWLRGLGYWLGDYGWRILLLVVVVVALGWICWAARPWFQPLLLGIYNNLLPIGLGVATIVAFVVAAWVSKEYYEPTVGVVALWVLVVVLLVSAIFFSFYCPAFRQVVIADQMEPLFIDELPETARVRYTPLGIAQTLMRAMQVESHLKIGDIDPVDLDGQFVWIAPRVPNGLVNALSRSMDGFLVVREDEALPAISQPFEYGEGSLLYRNIIWQLRIRHYGCSFPEIFYLPDPETDGGYMGIVPYVGWRWHRITTVPYWAGVAIFHAGGEIEDLTVEEALADPRFEGQRLFPEMLTLLQARSWAYKDGVANAWFRHIDQVEIPQLRYSDNQMPFLLPGNIWMVAAEPAGPSQSVFKIFFFDAHNGALKIYEFSTVQAVLGPNVAWGYAQSGTPGYVWRESSGAGTYILVEARPVIKSGKLYWMYSVTTSGNDGIAFTILVGGEASTILMGGESKILHFCSRDSFERWITGAGGSDPIPCGAQSECPVCPSSGQDLGELSPRELLILIQQATEELEKQMP